MKSELKLSRGRTGPNERECGRKGQQGIHSRCSIHFSEMLKKNTKERVLEKVNEIKAYYMSLCSASIWVTVVKCLANSNAREERAWLSAAGYHPWKTIKSRE